MSTLEPRTDTPAFDELRKALSAFSQEWADAEKEDAESAIFWHELLKLFGISKRSSVMYQKAVYKLGDQRGRIDAFIPGKVIIEHKSRGKDLDAAFSQAGEYFLALSEAERPRWIIVSDFARFRVYDLSKDNQVEFGIAELAEKADKLAFLFPQEDLEVDDERPLDRTAAYKVADLHDALLARGFEGRDLEVFLTRLIFCLFADDSGLFGANGQFYRLVRDSDKSGKGLSGQLLELFQVLDQSPEKRSKALDAQLASFGYVNGSLFSERMPVPPFDAELRSLLLTASSFDWSTISPSIFGAMFQGILEHDSSEGSQEKTARKKDLRHELGAHYTSERNILKALRPLFLEEFQQRLENGRRDRATLLALLDELPRVTVFDPACGCGNFLVVAFRELRRLEMNAYEALYELDGEVPADAGSRLKVSVAQCFGIEIVLSAVHVARVALWLVDHQLNLESARRFGSARRSLPLKAAGKIVNGNAIRMDWSSEVIPPEHCSVLVGNPPFVGAVVHSISQKEDRKILSAAIGGRVAKAAGTLDYVGLWYLKAAQYLRGGFGTQQALLNPEIDARGWGAGVQDGIARDHVNPFADTRCAFVSTSSITQGEQVPALWPYLLENGISIHFAHRTFQWSNEGAGVAAVHCVIIGFGLGHADKVRLFDYETVDGDPIEVKVKRLNPYLLDQDDVVVQTRREPLGDVPTMMFGNMPADGGHLLLDAAEAKELRRDEPGSAKFILPLLSAKGMIEGKEEWCLWLEGIKPAELQSLPLVAARVRAVRSVRLKSSRPELADVPTQFAQITQRPDQPMIVVPGISSERRRYIPMLYVSKGIVANNRCYTIQGGSIAFFALLNSEMHMTWMRKIGGRLESRYSYSKEIVYNAFPWPDTLESPELAASGQAILDARKVHPESNLKTLYDPDLMPANLIAAHRANDRLVDKVFGYKGSGDEEERLAFLLKRYQVLTADD
jgi:hypothetical protein